jgi:hypothetical protein
MGCKYEQMARDLEGDFTDEERKKIGDRIRVLMDEGMPQEQAVAEATEMVTRMRRPLGHVPRFKATQHNGGAATVHDVPIFVTCKRGETDFSEEWIDAALEDAKVAEEDGYFPPMHVNHHGKGEKVRAAGMFHPKRKEVRRFKGQEKPFVIADLVFTKPDEFKAFQNGELPYRSVEIYDVRTPKFDGLALLDHEPPYLEMPATLGADFSRYAAAREQGWTIFTPDRRATCDGQQPVVGFFRRGTSVAVMMEASMADEFEKKDEEALPAEAPAEEAPPAEGPEEEPQGIAEELAGGEMSGVDALIEGIIAFKGTMDEIHLLEDALKALIDLYHPEDVNMPDEQVPEQEPTTEPPLAEGPGQPPIPATGEGPGQVLQRRGESTRPVSPREAALMGRVDALEAKDRQRDEEESVRTDVFDALAKLDGRAFGSDREERLTTFRRQHGGEAFQAYVGELEKTLPAMAASRFDVGPSVFDMGEKLPDEVLAFQKDGPEAIEKASQHSREYDVLRTRGMAPMSRERYLEIQMNGYGS